jgi:hypothetical protein
MPRRKSPATASSAEVDTTVAQVTSDILALLADGVPRSKPAVVEALAGQHDLQDVVLTLIRLGVTGQVREVDGKFTLATA